MKMYNRTDTIEIFEDINITEKELQQLNKNNNETNSNETNNKTNNKTNNVLNNKYDKSIYQLIIDYIKLHKLLFGTLLVLILVFLIIPKNIDKTISKTIQSGGNNQQMNEMEEGGGKPGYSSKIMSPVSSTFNLVLTVVGKFLKLILLLFMIILVPTVPILIYCLMAYFVIRKFLNMFTTIR